MLARAGFGFGLAPLEKGATGDLLLILLQARANPPQSPFFKGGGILLSSLAIVLLAIVFLAILFLAILFLAIVFEKHD